MTMENIIKKPEISIFCSAHRPKNWPGLFESIGDNDINFEIIFVGPNEPDFKVPDNFRFIKSNVKPAQCSEIAARNTTGDLIIDVADDMDFKTKKPLDTLYNEYKSYNDDKIILSCRFMINGIDASYECHRYNVRDPESPVMPVSGLISRKLYRDIGGIDKNFICVYWSLDIAMRIFALGGRVVLSKDVYVNEDEIRSCPGNLLSTHGGPDIAYLHSLWSHGKSFNRSKSVEPFSDERILEESQGPKGKWL